MAKDQKQGGEPERRFVREGKKARLAKGRNPGQGHRVAVIPSRVAVGPTVLSRRRCEAR